MSGENITLLYERICNLLTDRKATIFLGAGINADISTPKLGSFPLGGALSEKICTDLLDDENLKVPLDEAVEFARYKFCDSEVNKYLYNYFSEFQPGIVHQLLTKLPWDVIYTTNFDLLLETECRMNKTILGNLHVITSIEDDISNIPDEDTIYYKLHGSIDLANSKSGRLTLTKEDYRLYKELREPLFRRLKDDLSQRTFVFIGYSLKDSNFREIIDSSKKEMGINVLPLSYAIVPHTHPTEKEYWRERYNIHLIDMTSKIFLENLVKTWDVLCCNLKPFEERYKDLFIADDLTSFPRFFNCYYRILPDYCTGKADPKLFFKGGVPSWAIIRDGIPIERDAMWALMESLFEEFANSNYPASIHLIKGHAGTGKTTLLRTIAYLLAKDFNIPVIVHISGTPLEKQHIKRFVELNPNTRVVVIIHSGSELLSEIDRLLSEAKKEHLHVTLLIEERTNLWEYAYNRIKTNWSPNVIELNRLSEKEIRDIVDVLEEQKCMGILSNTDRDLQIQHFTAVADKELLVALRELTTGTRFDEIIKNEYESLPSENAKRTYKYIAAIGQSNLYLRYAILLRILDKSIQDLRDVFNETEGVLISSEFYGRSRHEMGFKLRVRHPVIASIVFSIACPTDQEKFETLSAIIKELDPGYQEDLILLNDLIKHRELVNTFERKEFQRAIYDLLAVSVPSNPFVFQQRSILERELSNGEAAVNFARTALQMAPFNSTIKNTLGFGLEYLARTTIDLQKKRLYLSEATSLFEQEISKSPNDAFPYLGLSYIKKQQYYSETGGKEKRDSLFELLALLEQAREDTENSSVIEREYALVQEELGELNDAIETLKIAIGEDPGNNRVRELLVRFLYNDHKYKVAIIYAREGIKRNPTDWRLYMHLARLLEKINEQQSIIIENFDAAIRNNRGSSDLMVEVGAFLFRYGDYISSTQKFHDAFQACSSSQDRQRIRIWWLESNGEKKTFFGRVSHLSSGGGRVKAIPNNFDAFFWREYGINHDLELNDEVSFYVGFNAFGSRASIIRKHS